MSIFAELNRNPTRKDLLSFGLIVAAGLGAFGAYSFFRAHRPETALVLWAVGGAVFLLSLIPPIGRVLYILWMGLGLVIGFFTAPVIMFVLYALVIVPVGLWFKVTRRDTMRRQLDRGAKSYWEDYPGSDDPASYIRQF
jgi:hypothetical protein